MKHFFLTTGFIISALVLMNSCADDDDNPYFVKTIDFGKNDQALSVTLSENGEAIVCGHTNSIMTSNDALVIKISPSGQILWTKTFGGTGFDSGTDLILTRDQNIILTGKVTRNNLQDVFVMKINPLGQLIWSKYLGYTGFNDPFRVYPDDQNGFYLTAFAGGDMKVSRFGVLGDSLWAKTIGKYNGADFGRSLHVKSDGHILFCGNTNSFVNDQSPFLMELDAFGDEQWTTVLEFPQIHYIYDMAVIEPEGIFLVGQYRISIYGNYRAVIIKTDMNGQMLWRKELSYPSSSDGYYHIEITRKNELLLTGYVTQDTLSTQFFVEKVSPEGVPIWTKTFGQKGEDRGYRSKELPDGDIVSAGIIQNPKTFQYDILMVKMDEDGNIP